MQTRKSLFGRFKKERVRSTQKTIRKEIINSECPYSFGYLTYHPKNISEPQQWVLPQNDRLPIQ